jgi:CheY-like chemotaxis protein
MKPNNLEILIVDDNLSFLKSFEMLLKSVLGPRIKVLDTAINGKVAVEMALEKNGYDYVFMDVNMPSLNGIEASKLISNVFSRKTKIIAISFNDDFQTLNDMIFSGATAYINKAKITFDLIANIFDDKATTTQPNCS